MDKRLIFARNVKRLLESESGSERQLGIERKRLWRWKTKGITRPDPSARDAVADLEKLADHFGLEVAELWVADLVAQDSSYLQKLKVILRRLSAHKTAALRELIDDLHQQVIRDWSNEPEVFVAQLEERQPELLAALVEWKGRERLLALLHTALVERANNPDTVFAAWRDAYLDHRAKKR